VLKGSDDAGRPDGADKDRPLLDERVMTSRGTRCLASRQSPLDREAGTFPRPALESANQGARRSRHSTTSALLRPFRASKLLWGDTCRTRGPASGSEAALGVYRQQA